MAKMNVNCEALAGGRVLVVGQNHEISVGEKELIRNMADSIFEELEEVFEENENEELFDMLMDIFTSFVDSKEYEGATVYQDVLLRKCRLYETAERIPDFLEKYEGFAEVYFRRMAVRSLIYHDVLISCDEEDEECYPGDSFIVEYDRLRKNLEDEAGCDGSADEESADTGITDDIDDDIAEDDDDDREEFPESDDYKEGFENPFGDMSPVTAKPAGADAAEAGGAADVTEPVEAGDSHE